MCWKYVSNTCKVWRWTDSLRRQRCSQFPRQGCCFMIYNLTEIDWFKRGPWAEPCGRRYVWAIKLLVGAKEKRNTLILEPLLIKSGLKHSKQKATSGSFGETINLYMTSFLSHAGNTRRVNHHSWPCALTSSDSQGSTSQPNPRLHFHLISQQQQLQVF